MQLKILDYHIDQGREQTKKTKNISQNCMNALALKEAFPDAIGTSSGFGGSTVRFKDRVLHLSHSEELASSIRKFDAWCKLGGPRPEPGVYEVMVVVGGDED